MTDEEVIKRRLIFDGDGTGDDRRFNMMLKMITKWANNFDDSPEERRQTYDKILGQLASVEHSRRRSDFVMRSNEEQLIKYQRLHADYEKKLIEIREKIARQRLELEKAKVIKQNRIQYDLLAKAITAEPPRTEMNNKLVSLQRRLKDLGDGREQLMHKLDKRKKQFHVLSTSANQLRACLEEDAREENELSTSLDDVTANSPEPMSE